MLVLLCFVKLAATVVSYASGNAGGVFAPSLFLGAMAGGAVGYGVQQIGAFPVGNPGAYALVGMGTLFAGIIRAPMTSVFMIFEITQDYQIIVPLIVANMLSFLISRRYQKIPVYHALLQQDDVHLPAGVDRTAGKAWLARDIMTRAPSFIAATSTVEDAAAVFAKSYRRSYLIGSADRLAGLVTRDAIDRAMRAQMGSEPVVSVSLGDWPFVYPDHPLELTLERLRRGPGTLPVLSRRSAHRVEGVITHDTVMTFLGQHPSAAPRAEG
jgi:CIC family chloride channel protein